MSLRVISRWFGHLGDVFSRGNISFVRDYISKLPPHLSADFGLRPAVFTQSLRADKSVGLHTSVMMWLTSSLGPQAGRGSPTADRPTFTRHSSKRKRAHALRHTLYLVRLCVSDPSLAPLCGVPSALGSARLASACAAYNLSWRHPRLIHSSTPASTHSSWSCGRKCGMVVTSGEAVHGCSRRDSAAANPLAAA